MKEQRSYQIVQIQFNFIFKTKTRVSVDVCNLPKLSPVAFTTELQVTFLFRIFRGWPSVYSFPQKKKLANVRENAGQKINVSNRLLLFAGTYKKLRDAKLDLSPIVPTFITKFATLVCRNTFLTPYIYPIKALVYYSHRLSLIEVFIRAAACISRGFFSSVFIFFCSHRS